jgi:hypothetical protein
MRCIVCGAPMKRRWKREFTNGPDNNSEYRYKQTATTFTIYKIRSSIYDHVEMLFSCTECEVFFCVNTCWHKPQPWRSVKPAITPKPSARDEVSNG